MVGTNRADNWAEKNDIEFILSDIGGIFGKFQIYSLLMLCYSMFVTGTFVLDYVFATLDVDHRCLITECESLKEFTFKPDWLQYATPFKNGQPERCQRFQHSDNQSVDNFCDINKFNPSRILNCDNGPFVYRTDEITIINEFNLTCDANRWKIAMVGTWSNIGRLCFLAFVGYLSDRFGRKVVLVSTTLIASMFKLLKSFASSYNTFVICEVLDAGISSAIYPSAMIMAMEMATSDRKILITCLITIPYVMGQVTTAFIASYLHNYKWLLRVIAMFGMVTIPYIWVLPESLRWLLVNQKHKDAMALVDNAARSNGLNISPKSKNIIEMECANRRTTSDGSNDVVNGGFFKDILFSCTLLTRLTICTFCWISSAFITYGISIMSVSLQGPSPYFNFMVVSFSGIPAILLTYTMMLYMRRRWAMSVSLLATGLSILASKLFSSHATISLVFFFLAKLFINHTFTALYMYTTEMWPTVLRHSVMGTCSMVGRVGSIAAPLAPLLMFISELLPFYLFSGFAFLSAIMIVFLPETFKQKRLPDSIDDIKNM